MPEPQDKASDFVATDPLGEDNHREAALQILESPASVQRFQQRLEKMAKVRADDLAPAEKRRHFLTLGIGNYLLGRLDAGLEALRAIKSDGESALFQGRVLAAKGDLKGALEGFERAAEKRDEAALEQAETLILLGRIEEAQKILKGSAGKRDSAQVDYLRGLVADANGEYEDAKVSYESALAKEPNHAPSLFRLGYNADLRGHEEEAVDYYERCLRGAGPTLVQAWINLGLLYEERGQADRAIACFQRVLERYPDHPRATRYIKDAEGTRDMYYDSEKKLRDAKAALLETPIAEFELSVRSRNCLAKMNIATLGDLLKYSEKDLLAYKNFGDTSLQEIKHLLVQKGLRLGEGKADEIALPPGVPPEILTRPIAELALSDKAQAALQAAALSTFGDLLRQSQEDLEAAGLSETETQEIRQRLSAYGLALAAPKPPSPPPAP